MPLKTSNFWKALDWVCDAAFKSSQIDLSQAQDIPEMEHATQRAFDAARAGGVTDQQPSQEVKNIARQATRARDREGHGY